MTLRCVFRPVSLSLAIATVSLLAACGESRQAQCDKIIPVVNRTADQMMTASPLSDGFERGAALSQEAATTLDGLELGDEKLSNIRYHLAAAYRGMAESSLAMASVADSQGGVVGTAETEEIVAADRAASQNFVSVANALEAYCLGGDAPAELTSSPPS